MVIIIIVIVIIIIIITVCGKEPLGGFEPARSAAAARAPDRCGDANFANKSPVLRQFAFFFASPLFSFSLSRTRNLVAGIFRSQQKKILFCCFRFECVEEEEEQQKQEDP
jgi:hypothetical protein